MNQSDFFSGSIKVHLTPKMPVSVENVKRVKHSGSQALRARPGPGESGLRADGRGWGAPRLRDALSRLLGVSVTSKAARPRVPPSPPRAGQDSAPAAGGHPAPSGLWPDWSAPFVPEMETLSLLDPSGSFLQTPVPSGDFTLSSSAPTVYRFRPHRPPR